MRFAIKTAPQHTTWSDMLDVWRAADEIPLFESAWNFDHFYPIQSDSTGPCLEAWTMLAAMAQATRRIRLGCMVTGAVYRHPAVLANMIATVDIVSGGRLEVGLGAGWNEEECGAYGIDLGTLTERFDRFDEACEVVLGLLRDDTTTFDGRYFSLTNARCEPKPVQKPYPPLCIGGQGERRTLRSVARYADHWNTSTFTAAEFARKRDVLHEHCTALGRDPGQITTSSHVRYDPSVGPQALADECARYAEVGLDLAIVYLPPPHAPSVLAPIADALAPLAS